MHEATIRQRAAELLAAHAGRQPFLPFTGDATLPSLAAAYAVQRCYVRTLAEQLGTVSDELDLPVAAAEPSEPRRRFRRR